LSVILILLLMLVFALDAVAETLNLRRFEKGIPAEFTGLYDPAKYRKARAYHTDSVRLALLKQGFLLLLLIAAIETGAFNGIDLWVRSQGFGPIWTGLVFLGLISLIRTVFLLPFNIYDTFVIEAKYGFNRTTLKTYIGDLIKGTVLSIVLGAPILALVLYFFERAGELAWVYSWLSLTLIQLVLLYLAPAVILPMFNKFSPLPSGELREEIERYARSRNFELSGIFTMDGSKRSSKANAFFTGFGKFRKLVLFDTMIPKHTVRELVAVVAHEVGHFKLKHIPKGIVISVITSGLTFYVFSKFLNNPTIFGIFKMESTSIYASLMFISIVASPIFRLLSIPTNWLSRRHEFDADRFSRETYGDTEALASALKGLSVDHLALLTPHPLKVLLDYSHPPVLERIQALRSGDAP